MLLTPQRRSPDLVNAMKVVFAGAMMNSVVEDSEFMKFVKTNMNVKTNTTTGGRYVEKATRIRRGGGDGARSEEGYLPEARRAKFVNPRINLRKLQTTVEMTGDAMRLVKGSEEAFLNWADEALPDAVKRATNSYDRQYIGTGSGIIAKVATKTATGITVSAPFGDASFTEAWLLFLEGDSIVFASDAAGTTLRNNAGVRFAIVGDINEDTSELTLESADGSAVDAALLAAITVGDFIFRGDSAGTNAPVGGENTEVDGVLAAVDDGGLVQTYHGIDRTTTRLLKGLVYDAGGGPLTEDVLVLGDELVNVRGGGKFDHLIMSHRAARTYWDSQKGGNRFINARGNFTGGLNKEGLAVVVGDRTLSFNVARKLPPELAFGLSKAGWERYSPNEFEWDDTTGSIFERVVDSTGRKDQFYAVGNLYENLHCDTPRHNIRFENLGPTP